MTKFPDPAYSITKLNNTHQRKAFSCGVKLLDDYLRTLAGQDARKHLSVTYVLNNNERNKIAGYYTLSASSIELADLPQTLAKKLPQYPFVPATLIGRIAIDLECQKQGLGEVLLFDALQRAYLTSQTIASLAVIVDAIDDSAIKFYKKYGFLSLVSNNSRLYLPMKSMESLFTE